MQITSQLRETKFAREGVMLDRYVGTFLFRVYISSSYAVRFFKTLGTDEMRAWYGPDHVSYAADRGAIGTLLISDELFR